MTGRSPLAPLSAAAQTDPVRATAAETSAAGRTSGFPALPLAGEAAIAPAHVPVVVDEHDAAGRCIARTSLLDGVPHGEALRYGAGGVRVFQAHYVAGKLCGPLRLFDEQGVLIQESAYEAGLLHGASTLYTHGRPTARRQYVMGALHGESMTYAPSGLVTSRLNYEAGKLSREALFLHDGVVVRRAAYRNGLLEGESRDYAADGALVQSAPYRLDLLHGTVRRYAPDGQVSAERRYADGKPLGAWQSPAASTAPRADGPPRMVRQLEKWMRG
ncbi:MAG TPA: toxin-antitoxin system YwqK family antitoxin [Paraburkholderia sp.]|jgi:antitoxin component YwqK of YwqJK toxin-antitoxin module|nr:toxin-antitoxin system YwqK family antitoxin [Paraburkholderia sp.]